MGDGSSSSIYVFSVRVSKRGKIIHKMKLKGWEWL